MMQTARFSGGLFGRPSHDTLSDNRPDDVSLAERATATSLPRRTSVLRRLMAALLMSCIPLTAARSEDLSEPESGDGTILNGLIETVMFSRSGAAYMFFPNGSINEPQLYIVSTKVIKGVSGDSSNLKAGWAFDNDRVISFQQDGGTIMLNEVQTAFRDAAEAPALSQDLPNLSKSPIARLAADDSREGHVAVEISRVLRETVLLPDDIIPAGWSLSNSRVVEVRNYANNTNIRVAYILMQSSGFSLLRQQTDTVITAGDRGVTEIEIQYSFIRLPDDGFVPRAPDERVGYYATNPRTMLIRQGPNQVANDILKWNLVRKEPEKDLSEPVKPIVFYLDPSIPEPYRASVRHGVLAWNSAFEKIGFTNAIEVHDRPAEAKWDAGDIDYNVISWGFSPGFSASFASFVHNPLTGEIIGADVTITDETFERAFQVHDLAELGGKEQGAAVAFADLSAPLLKSASGFNNDQTNSQSDDFYMSYHSVSRRALSQVLYTFMDDDPEPSGEELERDLIHKMVENTVTHEIGHALGLLHNFRGSTFVSSQKVIENGYSELSTGSVMDYDPLLFQMDGDRVKITTTTGLGSYDYWAIEYGYAQLPQDPVLKSEWAQKFFATERLAANGFFSPFDKYDVDAVPFDFGDKVLPIALHQDEAI
ncbi:MAG: DUF5117 domain-containing protein, partial [Alphaproteobacteria bacterium]